MHKVMCVDIEADDEEDAKIAAWEQWDASDAETYVNVECPDEEEEDS